MAASSVIGQLRVNLAMDSANFQSGAVRAQGSMRNLQGATQQLQRTTSGFSFRALNQQLSQVAQQTVATGQPMRALAVQAADIGLAFGPLGVAIGAVAGLVLPSLISALSGSAAASERFAAAAEATGKAMSTLDSTISSLSGLESQYKEAVEQGNAALADRIAKLIELREAEAAYQALELPRLIREQQEALRDLRREQEDAAAALAEAQKAAQDALNGGDRGQFEIALTFLNSAREAYEGLTTEADLAANRTEQLSLQLEIAKDNLEAASESAEDVVSSIAQSEASSAQMVVYLARLNSEASMMQGTFAGAAAAAQGIANALANGVLAAIQLRAVQNDLRAAGTMGGARPGDGSRASGGGAPLPPTRPQSRPDDIDFGYIADGMRDVGGAASGAADATERFGTVAEVLNRILHEFNTEQAQEFEDNMRSIADDAIGGFGDALGDFIESGGRDWDGFMDGIVDSTADAVAKIVAELATVELAKAGGQIGSLAGPIGAVVGTVAGAAIGFGLGKIFNTDGTPKADARAAQRLEIEKQILALQGKTAKLRQMELEGIDGQNRALAERLMLMQDEARIAAERDGLQARLLQVQGKEGALRQLEIKALDPANRALLRRIFAIEMETKAADRAALRAERQAAREEEREAAALARAEEIAGERSSLELQLLDLQGNIAEIRRRELLEIAPVNRALQLRIWALQDEKEATDAAAAAAERLADSLKTDQFASLFDFERAVGRARYGSVTPPANANSIPAPIVLDTGSASGGTAETTDPIQAMMLNRMAKIEKTLTRWEKIGLPPERTVA